MKLDHQPEEKTILDTLIRRFCPQYDSLNILSVSRDTVIEVSKGSTSYIMKVIRSNTPHGRKINIETEWMSHLHDHGIGVPRLIRSASDRLVERAGSGDLMRIGYCYEKVPINFSEKEYWVNPPFIQELGSTVGRMHTLAESFKPSESGNIPSWESREWIRDPERYFHPSQSNIINAIHKLREQISKLDKGKRKYGLIHDDLHTGNVFKADGKPILLDFECLHLNWFVAEIASTLLFRTWIGPEKETPETKEMAIRFLRDFIAGYRKEHDLEAGWHERILLFLRLREISLFADYANIDVNRAHSNLLFWYVYRSIGENRPFLDIDFSTIP
jgi:Ser/Thr protein kinase RdoA (MazF antagonist)